MEGEKNSKACVTCHIPLVVFHINNKPAFIASTSLILIPLNGFYRSRRLKEIEGDGSAAGIIQ